MGTGLLILVTAMLVVGAIENVGVIFLFGAFNQITIVNILAFMADLFVFYYAVKGYKKPHGNILRYCIFTLGIIYVLNAVLMASCTVGVCCLALAGAVTCYISGRLDKFNKNRILFVIVIIFQLVFCITGLIVSEIPISLDLKGIIGMLTVFSSVLQMIPVYIIYVCRYKEHKEAGLKDATKE